MVIFFWHVLVTVVVLLSMYSTLKLSCKIEPSDNAADIGSRAGRGADTGFKLNNTALHVVSVPDCEELDGR